MEIPTPSGLRLHAVVHGPEDAAETVVLSHSYLADHTHFAPQIRALSARYRVIAYDHRDHGRSDHARAPYDLSALVEDAVAVIGHTGAAPCHWVGLSTGGFVGMRLALDHRALLRSAVWMDTSAEAEPWRTRLKYGAMLAALRVVGTGPLMGAVIPLMFGRSTLDDPDRAELVDHWRRRMAANDPQALIRFGRAIWSRDDVLQRLRTLDLPVLAMGGLEDLAMPRAHTWVLSRAVPGATRVEVPRAGHLCTVEQPEVVNAAILDFLDGVGDG